MISTKRRSAIATLAAIAAVGAAGPASAQDLRSPDAVDAAQPKVDRRAPDTVDAAKGRAPSSSPVTFVPVVTEPSDGFDWGDAAIGAGGLLGLLGIAGGAGVLVVHHRRSGRVAAQH